jgi:DNA-binding NtrC family response regulator
MALILVVEDEDQVRLLADGILAAHGYPTISVSTIERAIAILDGGEKIDALFVDLVLHGDLHGGLRLAQEAVKRVPTLPVLYTTGQGITDAMQALFVENSAFLGQPYTGERLIATSHELLNARGNWRQKCVYRSALFRPGFCTQTSPYALSGHAILRCKGVQWTFHPQGRGRDFD